MGASPASISVVIPTLNAGRAFATVLHRIMGQGRQPIEILCLDGGSTDATRHIASQFPLARFVEVGDRPGASVWNRGMEASKGEIVAFLSQDAIPANGDWLSHLTAAFEDRAVGGVYGRQEATIESDALSAFRLGQRFCREAHWRRIRIGDRVPYKSLPFSLDNAAVRRSIWQGIHFNERLPLGADRVWARQAILASCTIAYAPDALIVRRTRSDLKTAYRTALLTGFTDAHYGDEGGSLWPDSRKFGKRAAWYLFRGMAWGQLPTLWAEAVAQRAGYRLGRRLERLPESVTPPKPASSREEPQAPAADLAA